MGECQCLVGWKTVMVSALDIQCEQDEARRLLLTGVSTWKCRHLDLHVSYVGTIKNLHKIPTMFHSIYSGYSRSCK